MARNRVQLQKGLSLGGTHPAGLPRQPLAPDTLDLKSVPFQSSIVAGDAVVGKMTPRAIGK